MGQAAAPGGWTPRVLQAYLQQLVQQLHRSNTARQVTARHDRVRSRLVALLTKSMPGNTDQSAIHRAPPSSFALPPRIAKELVRVYGEFPAGDRATLAAIVAQDLATAHPAELRVRTDLLSSALASVRENGNDETAQARLLSAQVNLRHALTPLYVPILEAMLRERNGLETIVTLRGDVLRAAEPLGTGSNAMSSRKRDALRVLAEDLSHLLRSHFCGSTLTLREISTDSPLSLIQRMAVVSAEQSPQPVLSAEDMMSSRIAPENKRVYAFFHHLMADEPLVFVEVAVLGRGQTTDGYPTKMKQILHSHGDADSVPLSPGGNVNVAVFYSITACQPGLAGMDLGGDLIKRVVREQLAVDQDLNGVRKYITMSPMPGFSAWLRQAMPATYTAVLQNNGQIDTLPIAARYLVMEKKRGAALDSVANFHLKNGAFVARIVRHGDNSSKRKQESFEMMVCYEYDLDKIEENAAQYILHGTVACSDQVHDLLEKK